MGEAVGYPGSGRWKHLARPVIFSQYKQGQANLETIRDVQIVMLTFRVKASSIPGAIVAVAASGVVGGRNLQVRRGR